MIFLTTVATVTAVTTVIFFLLSQYFWKDKFDTFDNQCDVFRAAFCDSGNDFFFLIVGLEEPVPISYHLVLELFLNT